MNGYAIEMEAFAERAMSSDSMNLLDIRNKNDHQNWAVSGRNINTLNVPFSMMGEHFEEITAKFLKEDPVYVLCYKGILAQKAASLLRESGYSDVRFVKGGMKAWGDHIQSVKVGDLSRGGKIYQFIRLGKGCLSYMVVSEKEALVVDPARNIEPYLTFARENGWNITQIADTHLHADHISGGRDLAEQTGASYWFPCQDGNGARFRYKRLEDGLRIPIGHGQETVFSFSTPGHTLGSMSLLVDDVYLLCGDCLFMESVGRPDLAGKAGDWAKQLRSTLFTRFRQLPEELVVLPAHFGKVSEVNPNGSVQATLKELYLNNPVLQFENEEAFIKAIMENLPQQPDNYQKIRKANIGIQQLTPAEQEEIESGPNRCAAN